VRSLRRSAAGGRPLFPPLERGPIARVACTDPAACGVHLARWDRRRVQPVVVERAVVDSMHSTTAARLLAAASWQPHRRRDGKTAPSAARFVTQAAQLVWRYERVEGLYDRGEVGLGLDENPPHAGVGAASSRAAHAPRPDRAPGVRGQT
jgi:hypothetical protein